MRGVLYDCQLLLTGVKRNEILDLWELQRYGSDSYGDANHVCIYGMRPADWYSKGIRLLGRTAVECTRDGLGGAIGKDVAAEAPAGFVDQVMSISGAFARLTQAPPRAFLCLRA